MYKACKTGGFPELETMCTYGLSGFKGSNPIALFECYKSVIKYDRLTEHDLSSASRNGTLQNLIMKSPSIQKSPYYLEVMKNGGVQVAPKKHFECETCGFYSTTHVCKC